MAGKHTRPILFLLLASLFWYACDDSRDWEKSQEGVILDVAPKKLMLDIPSSKSSGLLQEGVAPDPTLTGYNLHLLYGYGKTVVIDIRPETNDWGIVFRRITHTFEPDESGINWPGESGNGYVFVPAEEEALADRPYAGPLRSGNMPLLVSISDPDGRVLLSQKTNLTVYDKNKVLKTVGELNEQWKLAIGDAEFYVGADENNPVRNEKNKIVLYGQLRNAAGTVEVVDNFEGRGFPLTRIKKGTTITNNNLDFKQYVVVENITGLFWQSVYAPYTDPAPGTNWARESARAQIFDYETGNEIDESPGFSVYLCGSNGKNSTNVINNNGATWESTVLAGNGNERVVDIKKSSSNWPFGTVKPCTFGVCGTYILQWELLNKRPGNNLSMPLKVVGKIRLAVQVTDEL